MLALPAGSELAGYRIEGVAGRGGMGTVYRATDIALDRPVALKLIADEFAGHGARDDTRHHAARRRPRPAPAATRDLPADADQHRELRGGRGLRQHEGLCGRRKGVQRRSDAPGPLGPGVPEARLCPTRPSPVATRTRS